MLNELNRLQKDLDLYKAELSNSPQGSLSTSRRRNGTAYYHRVDGKRSYIPASNTQLIHDLADKLFLERKIIDIENEIQAINQYIKNHKEQKLENFFEEHSKIASLLHKNNPNLSDPVWCNKVSADPVAYKLLVDHTITEKDGSTSWNYNGPGTAPYQEKRTTNTLLAFNVRSKSEAFIANELFSRKILFIYEPEVIIDGRKYYPDFYIFHPVTGRAVIHEHGGIFTDHLRLTDYNDEERKQSLSYSSDFSYKLQHYVKAGWIPGINLMITSETKFESFDMAHFLHMIDDILGSFG